MWDRSSPNGSVPFDGAHHNSIFPAFPNLSRIFPQSFPPVSLQLCRAALVCLQQQCHKEQPLNKYRRIEVNAFRRKVTIVSGEWPASSLSDPPQPDQPVPFDETNTYDLVEPASPEGQQILVEAVRSLERRLSPEALETIRSGRPAIIPSVERRNGFQLWFHSLSQFFGPGTLRFARKEK